MTALSPMMGRGQFLANEGAHGLHDHSRNP
jgi:hypothetical protein